MSALDADVCAPPDRSWAGFCCPVCAAALSTFGAGLRCAAEERWFATSDGVHRLLAEERRRELQPVIDVLQQARAEAGPVPDRLHEAMSAAQARLGLGSRRVLQVFAGRAREASRLCAAGHRVVALDPVLGDLATAPACDGLERAEADLESLPLEPGHFEIVIAGAALHHAPRLSRTLVELRRVTRRGGVLVAWGSPVFRRRPEGEMMVDLAMKAQARRYGTALPREMQPGYLVLGELPGLFRSAGWKLVALEWPGPARELLESAGQWLRRRAPTGRRPLLLAVREG